MNRLICFVVCLVNITVLFAHPGRLDGNGGHNSSSGYHYHGSRSNGAATRPRTSTTATPDSEDEILHLEKDIAKVQELLKELKFYSGEITGKADAQTLECANRARLQYKLPGTADTIRQSLWTRLLRESIGI